MNYTWHLVQMILNLNQMLKQIWNNALKILEKFMIENKMKRNDYKTVFLIIGTAQQFKKIKFNSIQIGNTSLRATNEAKTLGKVFGKEPNVKLYV